MNTIELPKGNNVVPLRSDTIRLEIIENLSLYDHEGWNDSKDSVRLVKAISTPQGTSKTPDRRLLELEDQINFLLKGSRPTSRSSSTHVPQAYAEAVYSNPHSRNLNESLRQIYFTFCERVRTNPQPQALETSFKAQGEEINDRMTEMFEIFKELITSRAHEKVLIREEAKHPVTKNINSILLIKREEEMNADDNKNKAENGTKNERIKSAEKEPTQVEEEESAEAPSSQPVGNYLKHRINEKIIEGLVENHRFNDSLLAARVGKMRRKTYNLLPRGPVYEAILKKKITKKQDIRGNFEMPCNIGGLKHMNALVDQGSNVNVMPLSTYEELTNKKPAETDIRLS
nr:hypothetical protein [Tanacetum cinerariifolium]